MRIQGLGTNDPLANSNWAPEYIGADIAWETSTGEGIVVAVLDTGIDVDHVDLDANVWTNSGEIAGNGIDDDGNGFVDDVYGWNFTDENTPDDVSDGESHGTHVAGLIAAEKDNGKGIVGVAPDAQVMAVKVLDDDGGGSFSDVAAGIDYAVENGAQIINMSLAGSSGSRSIDRAIARAQEAGVLIVAAAGNESDGEALYPAAYAAKYDNVLSVAALNVGERLAGYSNYSESGTTVDLAAPGSALRSTTPGDSYGYKSGTSMASPVVAAAAAVIWAAQPGWSYLQVIEVLESTVELLPSLEGTSATDGVLDLAAAMELALADGTGNGAPVLEVDALVASLEEGTSTEGGLRIADVTVTDDGVGVAVVELTGADAADFELRDGGLYLREGVVLDFETRPELSVTITVDDPDLPGGPEARHDVTLAVEDVDEDAPGGGGTGEGARPTDFAELDFWFDATELSDGNRPSVLIDLGGGGSEARASGDRRGDVEGGGLVLDGDDVYTIADAEGLSLGGPFDAKTLSFSIQTGDDVDDQQFVYEQGGKNRGFSVTIEAGELHVTAWSTRGERWGVETVSTAVEADTQMSVSLVFDAGAGVLSGYLDGDLFGTQSGVGLMNEHGGGIALGGVSSRARDADGTVVGSGAGRFEGTIYAASSHSAVLDAADVESLHAGFAEDWGPGGAAVAGGAADPDPFGPDAMVFATDPDAFLA